MKKSLSLLSIALIAIAFIGYFIKYAMNIFLANHMSPMLFGNFTIILKFILVTSTIILLGTNVTANRFLSNYLTKANREKQHAYIGWNIHLLKKTTFYYFITILLITLLFHFYPPHHWHPALHILWVTPLYAFALLLMNYLQANKNILLANFLSQAGCNSFILLSAIFMIYFFRIDLNKDNITLLFMISFTAFASFLAILVRQKIFFPQNLNYKKIIFTKPDNHNPKWLKISLKMITTSVLFIFISLIDLTIIKLLHNNPHDVGHYAAIITIGSFVILGSQVIYNSFKSDINYLIKKNKKRQRLKAMIAISNRINLSYTLLVTFLIIFFNQTLLGHFGPSYTKVKIPLFIMLGTYFLASLSKLGRLLLAFGRYEKILLNITLLELLILISFAIPMTYFYGIEGMSIATLIGATMRLSLIYYFVKTKLKLNPISLFSN